MSTMSRDGLIKDAGVYGPGYEERRAQRIKENYGIDVPRSHS